MAMRIAHLSDLHFGRIAFPEIVDVLLHDLERGDVGLVVISGDLTQRALPTQYREAARMLASLKVPFVVVPGNHDVLAWWRPVSRIVRPLSRYQRYIGTDASMHFEDDGVAVLGINSAVGHTIKGGHINRAMRQRVQAFFAGRPASQFKVLAVHHQLTSIPALQPHDVARGGAATLEIARRLGVDLILCGHLHVSHVETLKEDPNSPRIVVASAGTVTSDRGRRTNRNMNYYHWIDVAPGHFQITERHYEIDRRQFVETKTWRFERPSLLHPSA